MKRQKRAELKLSLFPQTVGPFMWANLDIPDILNLATNTAYYDWFTTNVVVAATDFSVRFVSSERAPQDHWEIRMKFNERPEFVWFLYPHLRRMDGARMRLNIAGHQLLSKEVPAETPGEPPMLYSFVPGYQQMIIEILDWLAVFFKFELTNIMIGTRMGNYELKANWGQLARAKDLLISDCRDSSFITDLLQKRHGNGLRTLIEFAEIGKPGDLTVECLSSLDYLSARMNFSLLDSAYFTEYIRNLLQRDVPNFHILRARIPPWSLSEVHDFKAALNLEDSEPILKQTHRIRNHYTDFNDRSRMFQFQKDERMIFAFYFLLNEEQQYTRVAVAAWLRRGR